MCAIGSEYFDFFSDLERNNVKEWFHENKKRYENDVKKPFTALVEELLNDVKRLDPTIEMDPKDALFRINRDIRFSADKSPYNTVMKAAFARGGRKSGYAGYYLGLGADGLHVGGGMYDIAKSELAGIRSYIAENPDEFRELADEKSFLARFGGVKGEKNKRIPAEFREAAERVPEIANTQFYYMAQMKPGEVPKGDALREQIVEHFSAITPFNSFLNTARG